jgi:hypothetical protein
MNTQKLLLKISFIIVLFCNAFIIKAQSVAINTDGSSAAASALLDVKSTTQGILIPRMTAAQRTAIATPATGLMVYQTDATAGFYFYNGTAWTSLNGTNGTNGTNGQGVPTGGTANQVLAKVNGTDYNTAWVTPSGGGVKLELLATKIAATQTLPNANTINLPDVVVYDNVVTAPTIGTYSNNTYTAGAAGLYLIQIKFSAVQNATANNTTSAWGFVELNGTSLSVNNNVYAPYISSGGGGSNLPTGYKGVTTSTFVMFLNTNDFIKIRGLNQNSSVSNSLNNDGGCQFMVVKMN